MTVDEFEQLMMHDVLIVLNVDFVAVSVNVVGIADVVANVVAVVAVVESVEYMLVVMNVETKTTAEEMNGDSVRFVPVV